MRPLVIGAGNPDRGDDAAGPTLIRRLKTSADLPCDCAETSGEATAILALIEGRDRVIVVDACQSGGRPGTIHRFDAAAGPLPAILNTPSSHGLGVAAGLELARALGQLPPQVVVLAIEGACFDHGAPLSKEVEAAIGDIIESFPAIVTALQATG
jgi:hydrogenase maturation protease